MLALVIDYMSAGPDSLRDRAAFLLALAGFRDGFDGSPLDQWTVQQAHMLIGKLLDMTGGAYIAGASINTVTGAAMGCLAIYAIGCLVPDRFSGRMGRWAALRFPRTGVAKINVKLWVLAFLLGILADLSRGAVGDFVNTAVEMLTLFVSPIPIVLFGSA